MVRIFFSYSHQDEEFRNELEKHLAALRHEGIVEMWHDRQIVAGRDFSNEISEHIEKAEIILLLVSADFIASDYCYGIEMTRAMERHESGESHVIPVILRPSDWQGLPFGRLLATPTDGKPVTKFPDRDDGFLEVVKAIRMAAEKSSAAQGRDEQKPAEGTGLTSGNDPRTRSPGSSPRGDLRSSNLRIKKTFTDHEKDHFVDEAFEYIANYFEGSLAELKRRNPGVETRFKRIDSNQFTAAIYASGDLASSCRIWMGGNQTFGGIAYSASEKSYDNSINESLSVDDDGFALFLKPLMSFRRSNDNQQLTREGGAEYLWGTLIEPLQR